jgi:MaoC like domain
VTTRAATLDMLRSPGLALERSLELSGQWFNELCLWMQSPIGELGPIGWPMCLIPEIIDSRYRLGDEALQVYQRVEWFGPVPRLEFTASAHVEWVSSLTGSFEAGVATEARLGDELLAQSLLVARMVGELESYGTRALPARPDLDVASLSRRRTLVVDEASIRHFAGLAGTHYPVHEDQHYAWGQGYPTILVQGLLLFIIQLHYAGIGSTGRGEMWFRRAVPAGSLLESCQSTVDPTLWAMRLVGGGEVAAIARIASTSSSSRGAGP